MTKARLLSLAALLAVSASASAEVYYDADGVGSAGKGDIQDLFAWNSAALAAHADGLRFQLVVVSGATWQCFGINPQGKEILTTHGAEQSEVATTVAVEVRKNRQGQVTGFVFHGAEPATTEYVEIGACPYNQNWQQIRAMVPDSLVYSGGGAPMLQVSADDGTTWHDLPVTPAE
jgi:hypothetical protein